MDDLLTLARKLESVARAAGAIEMHYFKNGAAVIEKQDGSPVTVADREAETLIAQALKDICPDIPMVGEESVAANDIPDISSGTFFLVDPLDGTRAFISGSGDFTVNIALLRNFTPVMGVIYAPVSDALYYGAAGEAFMSQGGGAPVRISVATPDAQGLRVVASRHHGDPAMLDAFLAAEGKAVASLVSRASSLKFCAVAAGEADLYPRFAPTSEWDTAAGEAILRAAGGSVTRVDGTPMVYGKKDVRFLNPHFIARGG